MQDIGPFLNQNDPIQSLIELFGERGWLFGHKIPALIYSQGDFFQDGKSPLNHHLGYVIVLTFFQPSKNCKNTSIHGKLKKNERMELMGSECEICSFIHFALPYRCDSGNLTRGK